MTTTLHTSLKRELSINGDPYVLTIEPHGFKLVPKGKRKGFQMDWSAFVSGDQSLATALIASLKDAPIENPAKKATGRRSVKKGARTAPR